MIDRMTVSAVARELGLHARLLNDFFKHATGKLPTARHKANDRYAAEYCVNVGWNGIEVLTEQQHTTIDKQLSHFTTRRAARTPHPLGLFALRAVDALAELARRADPIRQGRLRDILAKAHAEQQRTREAWNAT